MILYWFRQDLRLADNPALFYAAQHGDVLPLFIWDTQNQDHPVGAASKVWLHHSLDKLNQQLEGKLNLYHGDPQEILQDLIDRYQITQIVWHRCYEPWQIKRDTQIRSALQAKGIEVKSFIGNLLWEPWTVTKQDGSPYKVFTPYYTKGCLGAAQPQLPLPKPSQLNCIIDAKRVSLDALHLLTGKPWEQRLCQHWQIGELGAQQRLIDFIERGLQGYQVGRDFPAQNKVSKLSPYLHFGEISVRQVWHAVSAQGDTPDIACFLKELAWREFSYYLLYHFPQLPTHNWHQKFDAFPWVNNLDFLQVWQQGKTGIPMIDAGMRELWQTGHMHNRVRMIVASFLTKNGLVDWRVGAQWFWDCLVDADLASNSASWQWVAGCGADAAPYFRIFNPILQSQKFDPDGEYIRRFVPELKELPSKYIHDPASAPVHVLQQANITLGKEYPQPIIDLRASRAHALDLYKQL